MNYMIANVLRSDYELLGNCNRLQDEGILLTDMNTNAGRVIFSLQEIPLRITFLTPEKNRIQRVSDNRVFIGSPDGESKCKIELSRTVNSSNKDRFLWSQEQSDLCILNDPKLLEKNGLILRDQITGTISRVHNLKDIPLSSKFFTENDNILERTSEFQISIGDKIIAFGVSDPMMGRNSFEDELSDCKEILSSIVFENTPGEHFDDNQATKVLAVGTLLDGPDFPKIKSCVITGTGYHNSPLRVKYEYSGGVEGNSIVRWDRCTEQEPSFIPIKGATSLEYSPTISDIGATLRVAYMPVRADGVTGMVVFSCAIKIRIDPEVKSEIDSNLAMNTLMFKVLLRNGNEFQKRSILLNRIKVKVRKRRSTITKMKYGPDLKVLPDLESDCLFTLVLSEKDKHVFMTPSAFQRDIIVLTIRAFNGS